MLETKYTVGIEKEFRKLAKRKRFKTKKHALKYARKLLYYDMTYGELIVIFKERVRK